MLNRKKQTVLSILFLFILLSAVLTAFQSFRYEAKSRVLLLQYNGEVMDPYNAAKSSQFISNLLANVVSSNSFLNDVLESGFNIDLSYFGSNSADKLERWEKTAKALAINDTGIIEINSYHPDKSQAEQINNAIINIIKNKTGSYYGRSKDISIKIIDQPIVSNWPVQPNIILNFALTIFISLMISFSYIILFPGEKYDLNILPKRKKKQEIAMVKKVDFADKFIDDRQEGRMEFVPRVSDFNERGDIKNILDQSNAK